MVLDIIVFGILTLSMFTIGFARVFHYKAKLPMSTKQQTTFGLLNLLLAVVATYYLLKMVGVEF